MTWSIILSFYKKAVSVYNITLIIHFAEKNPVPYSVITHCWYQVQRPISHEILDVVDFVEKLHFPGK